MVSYIIIYKQIQYTRSRNGPNMDIIGPLPLLVYSNDLSSVVPHCQAQQYADDTTLLCLWWKHRETRTLKTN